MLGQLVLCGVALSAQPDQTPEVHRLTVKVTETAGIRRFGYPVTAVLDFPRPVARVTNFRLLENGRPVDAQFHPTGEHGRVVEVDFNVNHAPHESRTYVVEYGSDVKPGPRAGRGVKVETKPDEFRVSHSGVLTFVVPRNLLGLLKGVDNAGTQFVRPGSRGLVLRSGGAIHRAEGFDDPPTKPLVVKDGPLSATLRFQSTSTLGPARKVASTVELDFPLSKSWVRVTWKVNDATGPIEGLGADLNLFIQGEPTLVDFGAGSFVYAQLRRGQACAFLANKLGWQTLLGTAGALQPYVVAPGGPSGAAAEGWAHVMDRDRCTAISVADFAGPDGGGEMTVDADGRLQVWRTFSPAKQVQQGPRTLTFWLHFVGMPVHVGAATSPQAMLAPLKVEVRRAR